MLLLRMHVASGRITPQMWLTRDALASGRITPQKICEIHTCTFLARHSAIQIDKFIKEKKYGKTPCESNG